ncbi:beta-D-glucosyl crocetin beta-1,6-glucosyltransferase-like [Nymphaea colorata]|nr:beta-D-glucosyl crocetin beta-1,6-glucosyltransferase-like [Nymphaea colorata]
MISLPPSLPTFLKKAFKACKPAITTLRPDFFIHDNFPPWASDVAAKLHIHGVRFVTFNASSLCMYYHFMKTGTMASQSGCPLESIGVADFQRQATDKIGSDEDAKAIKAFLRGLKRPEGVLMVRSVRPLEEKFLEEQTGKAILPVGTLLPQKQEASPGSGKFAEWLDTKRSSSVVFVSFGSEYFMTKEQIAEIAFGLELSEQSFIWVIRLAGEEIEEEEGNVVERVLPSGFLERVKDKGMVVRGWAAQTALEALPLSIDQPHNVRLVVGRESNGEFRREKVADAIRRVMVGEEGEELRKRGKDMAAKMKHEGEEGADELFGVVQRMYRQGNVPYKILTWR